MNLASDIQKIERDKRLEWCQELREIAIPWHQKRNMNKVKPTEHPKDPPKLRQNHQVEIKGEDVPKRPTEVLKGLPQLTCIWPVEEKVEASLDPFSI